MAQVIVRLAQMQMQMQKKKNVSISINEKKYVYIKYDLATLLIFFNYILVIHGHRTILVLQFLCEASENNFKHIINRLTEEN